LLKILPSIALSSLLLSSNAFAQLEIFNKALSATAFIESHTYYGFEEDDEAEDSTIGSGFLLDKKRGLVMTNAHVAGHGPTRSELRFYKQKKLIPTSRYFVDPYHDIALLKVDPSSIPEHVTEINLDCRQTATAGEDVFGIGHPKFTEFQIARGVISGEWDDNVDGTFWTTDLLIESGSSGGPVLSLETGKVIGISTATWKESNIGLVTRAQDACQIWKAIEKGESPKRPLLGFQQLLVNGYLSTKIGAIYDPSLPLQTGDDVLSYDNGKTWDISQIKRLADLLRGFDKQEVELTIKRGDETLSVMIPLKEGIAQNERKWVYFNGLTFNESIEEDDFLRSENTFSRKNAIRVQTRRVDYSETSGWQINKMAALHSINGKRISDIEEMAKILEQAEKDGSVLEFIFDSADWTNETWRYLFSRSMPVKDFDTNIKVQLWKRYYPIQKSKIKMH
jgi:S1-C subfamily serine protease